MNSDFPKETLYNIGVKAAILNKDRRLLLLNITRPNSTDTYWDFPGGRIADGETSEVTLRREVEEETSITDFTIGQHLTMALSNVQLPGPGNKKVGVVFSVYVCSSDSTVNEPEERITMHWMSVSEAVECLKTNPAWPAEIIEKVAQLR